MVSQNFKDGLKALSLLGGLIAFGYIDTPSKVHISDLNQDGLYDVVIETPYFFGPTFVYIQQPNGSFIKLKDLESIMKDSTEAKVDKYISGIEMKVDSLK